MTRVGARHALPSNYRPAACRLSRKPNRTEMNLTSSCDEVARRLGLRPDDVKSIVETFLDVISDALVAGSTVTFRYFGTFTPTHRYDGRTGTKPAHPTGIGFKAADAVKRALARRS